MENLYNLRIQSLLVFVDQRILKKMREFELNTNY